MNTAINPELTALREKVVSAATRQSIWQLIAMLVTLCGAIIGGLAYQTTMIDKRIDLRQEVRARRK